MTCKAGNPNCNDWWTMRDNCARCGEQFFRCICGKVVPGSKSCNCNSIRRKKELGNCKHHPVSLYLLKNFLL